LHLNLTFYLYLLPLSSLLLFPSSFFFNNTPTTHTYTLSLHDALPISAQLAVIMAREAELFSRLSEVFTDLASFNACTFRALENRDRKSTRLNSSHGSISYAVFCLKKKKKKLNNMGAEYRFDKRQLLA